MIAFQQNLIAATHAHELMAQLVEARVGVSAQEHRGQQRDQDKLCEAQFRVASFEFQVMNTNVRY